MKFYFILFFTFAAAVFSVFGIGDCLPGDPMNIAAQCEICHGRDGLATRELPHHPANLACQKPLYLKNALLKFRTDRRHDLMTPVTKNLTSEQMDAAVKYYSEQCDFSKRLKERTSVAPSPIVVPIVAVCGGCHGSNGISMMPNVPNLACQEENYLIKALTDFVEGRRNDPMMAGMLGFVKTPQGKPDMTKIDDLAQYFSSLCASYDK